MVGDAKGPGRKTGSIDRYKTRNRFVWLRVFCVKQHMPGCSCFGRHVRADRDADGLLTIYLQEESGGPPRKYYKLTELGRETYQNDRAEYLNFAQSIRTLLGDESDDKA